MKETLEKNKIIKHKSQLCEIFYSGIKSPDKFKIGAEYEKLAVKKKNYKAVDYKEIKEYLQTLKEKINAEDIAENKHLLGLQTENEKISLEPGAQVELSLAPYQTIHECKAKIDSYNMLTDEIADEMGFLWLGYGIQPFSTYENINLIPKMRYRLMDSYFKSIGTNAEIMMRETAGLQVNIDYSSEEDAINKLRCATFLSPIVSAMFANSPIRGGKLSNYRSCRTNAWLHVDENRCGLIDSRLFHRELEYSFENYCNLLLAKPVIYNQKTGKNSKSTFKELLNRGEVDMDDWFMHMSLYFPDVRLKDVIEIRNCDCQNTDLMYSFFALWKGLMYDEETLDEAFSTVEDFNWITINILRKSLPHIGLNVNFMGVNLFDIANRLVELAKKSLKKQAEEGGYRDESLYLIPLEKLVSHRQTQADIIARKWTYEWNKDPDKFIDYIRIRI